jgi:threonine dehydratase
MADLIELPAIRDAAERLKDVVDRTPVQESRAVSERAGVTTILKCEHLQRTGSFKLRGAYNRIVQLDEAERSRGVVCASAGNHAQGVALSAQLLGIRCRVFMPAAAPLPKVDATRGYGAEVVLGGADVGDALESAISWGEEEGAVFVHPFDHPDIIAGQGTLGLEIMNDIPEAGTIVVPVGGGGLVSGIAVAAKALRPGIRIVGVQAAGAAAFPASLAAHQPIKVEGMATMADGIAVSRPGELTLAHVRALVDEIVTVSDEAIARAVLLLAERAKQVVEPSGAAGIAAIIEDATPMTEPVVGLLCGGNVDPLLLSRIINSGMFEEGRYLALRTRLADRPGALSGLLALVARLGANVIGIQHHRLATRLGVLEVEVELEVETRGPTHIREVVDTLVSEGYPVG